MKIFCRNNETPLDRFTGDGSARKERGKLNEREIERERCV
jgi:hypothetical protein